MIQIDEIGVIYAPAIDETAPDALPGWHVNTTHKVSGWDAWRVTPAKPRRVFGGIQTFFYTFGSKSEFDSALVVANLSLPPPCPHVVTRKQARQALLLAGMLNMVQPAIDAITDNLQKGMVQIAWDDAQEFKRSDPVLLALAIAMGMTDEQLDQLFTTASGL